MPAVPPTGVPTSIAALALSDLLFVRVALTPAIVNANTTAEQTFAVSGIPAGNWMAVVNKPTTQAGLGIVGCRVSAVDQIAITFSNNTAGGITPTAGETYNVLLARVV